MALASLFNLAGPDLLIILLLFGAKSHPDLAKGMKRALEEFTKALGDVTGEESSPAEPVTRRPRPWRFILAKLHDGYATAVTAPFPLSL